MVPVVREVYEALGAERLMGGTDFPHVMRSCGYQDALATVQNQLDG
jgi:predicted TIM-barrel fold metal-dependent hydrolase